MNELAKNTKLQSQLEKDLQMDENGWISARKLYEYLGYSLQNYSRWVERNISNNAVFEENVDYKPLIYTTLPSEERTNTGFQPNPTQDYLISGELAKRFALLAHNEQGEKVRKLYLQLEEDVKQAYEVILQELQKRDLYIQELKQEFIQFQNIVEQHENRLRALEGLEKLETRWHKSVYDRVNRWIERENPKLPLLRDPEFIIGQIADKSEFDLNRYMVEYIAQTDNYIPDKLDVIESFEPLKKKFDAELNRYIAENTYC